MNGINIPLHFKFCDSLYEEIECKICLGMIAVIGQWLKSYHI